MDDKVIPVDFSAAPRAGKESGGEPPAGGKGRTPRPKKKQTMDDEIYQSMFKRFTYLYPSDTVYDHEKRLIARIGHLRHAFGSNVKRWLQSPKRVDVDLENVIFDASKAPGALLSGYINLFHGIEMKPKKGNCEVIRELVRYLCKDEDVYNWVIRWIAYPLQHPGAKMQTAIIMHGDEGTGKSFLWRNIVAPIYGEYAATIGQSELESQFNPWVSRKLFLVAEEVVSRAELTSHKGRLKHLVTGEDIQINDKNMPLRVEKNQANFVFLSNEIQPNKLDEGDRRYCVIFTPPPLDKSFYEEVHKCIEAGGIEAFYHELVHMDLTGFNPNTKPPLNEDKRELIEISASPTKLFFDAWWEELLDIPKQTCTTGQLYHEFSRWAPKNGFKFVPTNIIFSREMLRFGSKYGLQKRQESYKKRDNTTGRDYFFELGSPPDGTSKQVWLMEMKEQFDEAMKGVPHA